MLAPNIVITTYLCVEKLDLMMWWWRWWWVLTLDARALHNIYIFSGPNLQLQTFTSNYNSGESIPIL